MRGYRHANQARKVTLRATWLTSFLVSTRQNASFAQASLVSEIIVSFSNMAHMTEGLQVGEVMDTSRFVAASHKRNDVVNSEIIGAITPYAFPLVALQG